MEKTHRKGKVEMVRTDCETIGRPAPLSSQSLAGMLRRFPERAAQPVVLCIGTDRLIGDSLGPMTGTLLVRSARCPFLVYGTLAAPVHALNIEEINAEIKKKHPGSVVIAVDASLGEPSRIGSVTLRPGSLMPGAGVNKRLAASGDIAITGITGAESAHPYLTLQTVRLATVMEMAEEISGCLLETCTSTLPCHSPVCLQDNVR